MCTQEITSLLNVQPDEFWLLGKKQELVVRSAFYFEKNYNDFQYLQHLLLTTPIKVKLKIVDNNRKFWICEMDTCAPHEKWLLIDLHNEFLL